MVAFRQKKYKMIGELREGEKEVTKNILFDLRVSSNNKLTSLGFFFES